MAQKSKQFIRIPKELIVRTSYSGDPRDVLLNIDSIISCTAIPKEDGECTSIFAGEDACFLVLLPLNEVERQLSHVGAGTICLIGTVGCNAEKNNK